MRTESQSSDQVLQNVAIPPRPEILVEVSQEAKSDDPDLMNVASKISTDVAISGSILQVVNSPFYGLRSKVTSVQQAANLLGIKKIEKLVTTVSMRSQISGDMDLGRFWDSASEIANLCGLMAKNLDGVNNDDAFMLGLFHDCGIPIMMQHYSDYKDTLKECSQTTIRPITNIEVDKYSFHHGIVGCKLIKDWFLPEHLADAVLFHHDVEDMFTLDDQQSESPVVTLLAVLKMAEQVSFKLHEGQRNDSCAEWDTIRPSLLDYLGLSDGDFNELQEDLIEEFRMGD